MRETGDKDEKCPICWEQPAVTYSKLLQSRKKNPVLSQIWIYVKSYDFQTMQPIFKRLFRHNLSQIKHICGPNLPVGRHVETSASDHNLIKFLVGKKISNHWQ